MEGQGVYSPKEQYKQMFIEAIGKRPNSMVMWRMLDEIGFFNSPASANHHLNVPGSLLIHSGNCGSMGKRLQWSCARQNGSHSAIRTLC